HDSFELGSRDYAAVHLLATENHGLCFCEPVQLVPAIRSRRLARSTCERQRGQCDQPHGVPSKWSRYASPAFSPSGPSSSASCSTTSGGASISGSGGGSVGSNASGLTVSSSRWIRAIAPKFGSPVGRAGTDPTLETGSSS